MINRPDGYAYGKAQLSALLDAVEAGDEVVITRRGKRVARLVRDSQSPQNEDALLEDIDRGWLQSYPFDDARFGEASNLIARYP